MTPRHDELRHRFSRALDWTLLVTCTAILVLALIAVTGCQVGTSHAEARPGDGEAAKPTPTITIEKRSVPRYLRLTGTLSARQESDVAADGNGRVIAADIERGARVSRGQALVTLDARAARLGRDEALANGKASEAQRARAAADCARADKLFADQVIHQREHERLRAECEVTGWSSAAADVRRQQAQKNLADAVVRAPFAGVIDARLVDEGEYVRAGQAVARLVDIDELRLELSVLEAQVGDVAVGAEVAFEVAAFPGRTFTATVRHVPASLRAGSRDLIVEAVVDNRDHVLRPGMFASARLRVGAEEDPVVPRAALRTGSGAPRVFVLVDGRLEERLVQLGEDQGDAVAVLAGLTAGERIASPLTPTVRDGLKVE